MKLDLPNNFKQMLVECFDPSQSCDYHKIGDILFPVQVMTISLEKKIIRLSKHLESDYEMMLVRSVGEICHYYCPRLTLDWPEKNYEKEKLELFYLAHLEKVAFNDEIIKVVKQVEDQIEWKKVDEDVKSSFDRYSSSIIFIPIFTYLNVYENASVDHVLSGMTRGLLEIVKLNNMISNDRLRYTGKADKGADINDKMSKANTLSDFMAGLAEQGFNVGDPLL